MNFNETKQFFTDPDGDSLTLAFANGPPGVTFTDIGNGQGTVVGFPTSGTSPWTVDVTADDGNGGVTTETFTLICDPNGGVVVSAPGNQMLDACVEGDTFGPFNSNGAFTASDGSTPALSFSGVPSGVTFTDNGDGTWTASGTSPTGAPVVVTVTGTSGGQSASQQVTIDCSAGSLPIVPPVNCPFSDVALAAQAGNQVFNYGTFTGGAAPLTLTQTGLPPSWFTDLGGGSWRVTVPSNAAAQIHVYTVTATDNDGQTETCANNDIEVIGL